MKKIGSINNVFNVLSDLSLQHILILPHVKADADAMASSVSLARGIEQLKIKAEIIVDEEIPANLDFIISNFPVKIYTKKILDTLKKPNLIIMLDHHEIDRLNQRKEILRKFSDVPILIIDHHKTQAETEIDFQQNFGPVHKLTIWLESDRSSVSEMISELFLYPDGLFSLSLTSSIATSLMGGIYGDTGGLRYPNSGSRTFEICAALMQQNLEISLISEKLFGEKPLNQLRLFGEIFANAKLNQNGNIIWFVVKPELLEKYQVIQDDLEGLCSQMREVENIDLAILIRKISDDEIRVNLRSNQAIDVSELARKYGGGGHARAAGITLDGSHDLHLLEIDLIKQAELMIGAK
ncbi:MAG TPA: hypothetical protein GXZ43_01390 [Clostridiaceae bacterium]|nr:hypothetical protein [Clostridiaceae bacterium]